MPAADEATTPYFPPVPPALFLDTVAAPPPPRPLLLAANTPDSPRPYLIITAASVVLGILTVVLFWRATGLGLNLFAATLAGSLAALVVMRETHGPLRTRTLLLLGGCVLFSALYTWRGSEPLSLLNLSLVLLLGALALSPSFAEATSISIAPALLALRQSLVSALAGGFKWFRSFPWQLFSAILNLGMARTLLGGILLAVPLVFIFGLLFRSADQRFESLIQMIVAGFFENLFAQTLWFVLGAYVASGALRMAGLGRAIPVRSDGPPKNLHLHAGEASVCLLLVNLLFLVFVCLQLPYLFGGLKHVSTAPGLTMAEYARRGFFELATVAALVLPMLLGADWLLAPETSPRQRRLFRALCSTLLVLLAIIMTSALQRMLLYMQLFGLTQLRLFVSAFIVMLAAVFAWFAATVLRDRRNHFLVGALVIGCGFAFALQLSNPDARIAMYNLERCRAGHPCDFPYLAQLSTDALPAIVQQLEQGGIPEASKLVELLKARHATVAPTTWQSWNHSRETAAGALARL